MRTLKLHTASVLIMLTFSSLLQAQYILSAGKSNGESRAATPKPIKPSSSKLTPNAGLIVEKKDTKFQEAEAKRIIAAKKADAQRAIELQAIKHKAREVDKKNMKEWLEASKKRGRRQ